MSLVAGALGQMNEVNNLDKWVSHHLSGNEKYIDLFTHNSDPENESSVVILEGHISRKQKYGCMFNGLMQVLFIRYS